MEKYLTGDGLTATALFLLAVVWAGNMIFTFVGGARKERERAKEPFLRIDASINELKNKVSVLERRVDAHDNEVQDLHTGQSALCRGVQALLEHELHNGNDEEMRAASDSIGKWLRTR